MRRLLDYVIPRSARRPRITDYDRLVSDGLPYGPDLDRDRSYSSVQREKAPRSLSKTLYDRNYFWLNIRFCGMLIGYSCPASPCHDRIRRDSCRTIFLAFCEKLKLSRFRIVPGGQIIGGANFEPWRVDSLNCLPSNICFSRILYSYCYSPYAALCAVVLLVNLRIKRRNIAPVFRVIQVQSRSRDGEGEPCHPARKHISFSCHYPSSIGSVRTSDVAHPAGDTPSVCRGVAFPAGTFDASRFRAHGGRFLPTTGWGLRAPAPLGGIPRDTRVGAERAAQGDQGDGGVAATVVPSQSVEKVVPEATGKGDGLIPASGPGDKPGSNSREGASGRSVDDLPRTARDGSTGGDSRRDGTQSLSAWARAGLQNQAPGVRLRPAVPHGRRAARISRTAPAVPRAPLGQAALARDSGHRSCTLPARASR